MKQFKVAAATEALEFEVGDDKFTARPANRLPGVTLIRYVETIQEGHVYRAHLEFFEKALVEESSTRFLARLEDPDNPITLEIMVSVCEWLVESYSSFASNKNG